MADKDKIGPAWKEGSVISETVDEQERFVNNVIHLLDAGATIPFIARYRKEQTGDMAVSKLREVAGQLDDLRMVKTKMASVHSSISGLGKMTKKLEWTLRHARTMEEVDMLYAPYKPGHKGSLAERAKAAGLEPAALAILDGKPVDLSKFIRPGEKGVSNRSEVETGVQHIIADIIAKDKEVMEEIRRICTTSQVVLQSKQSKSCSTDTKNSSRTKVDASKDKVKKEAAGKKPSNNSFKFEQYFDFQCCVRTIKPHQILAINRGEEQKVLTVKINMPDGVKVQFSQFVHRKFVRHFFPPPCCSLIEKSIEDSFDRLIQPQMCRHIRSEQTKAAEKASIEVFGNNLHRLLLTSPVKGKTVLGVDPGFTNGCKTAVVSPTGQVLHTQVLYLHDYKANKLAENHKLISLIKTHRCEIIAIGNGKACRETEQRVSDLIVQNSFPLSVVYCIVDEGGASIYSVSDEAQKELPHLDPTLRGAVSIARRLQDPLSELVKIEPKHIGVGMYQHDVAKTKLQTALDSVVEECVSFTGVDLNTASHCLLRRVAGLNVTKANKVIEWRTQNGKFTNRSQLLKVKGLGEKSYEQCAGFVRVIHNPATQDSVSEEAEAPASTASTAGQKRKATGRAGGKAKKAKLTSSDDVNLLDMTAIHPESYPVANRFLSDLALSVEDLGKPDFIAKVKTSSSKTGVSKLAEQLDVGIPTMQLIVEALSRPMSYDFRSDFQKPLFKKGTTSMADLRTGSVLTGRVTNVTHFGAFVDIGVGDNGLIHVSKMRPPLAPSQNLGLGDHVEVVVLSVDSAKRRIGLQLRKLL
ncbi:S1 RNA-binding domain-containing protein 1-like [Babylonia areolata]|uniref:S1 RNA-binding domain-containing protein 1-like n=1 Tax=Babylonia areolata TaxID=304850 RepID=UPI003FCF03AE